MKLIFIIFFVLFTNSIFANEEDNNEVEVINLYESKSLDQMVLENLNGKKEIEEEIDNLNESNSTETKKNEIEENETSKIEVNQIEIAKDNFTEPFFGFVSSLIKTSLLNLFLIFLIVN